MKAAIVVQAGKTPIYGDFQETAPDTGEVQVTVSAAALSNVVRSRPSGKHYSSAGQFPLSPESMEWVVSTMAAVAVLSDMLPNGAFGSAK